MTGFGSAEDRVSGGEGRTGGRGRLRVEIRTVNHRYFNPQLKLPMELAGVEIEIRERLRQLLERGHVAVTARWVDAPHSASSGTCISPIVSCSVLTSVDAPSGT